ncbi:MAG TPA: PQQ-dependent sugar dehydrogenase [Anaerolineales bacterium]|nr:PQQ-dependent sugar dehydrogenase [Anaerolineales bacterium]
MKPAARLWLSRALLGAFILGLIIVAFLAYRLSRQVNLSGITDPGGLAEVSVPPGFSANVFASGLNGPRFIEFGADGVLYVADRMNNRIVALPDVNGDGVADETRVFAADVPSPHSLVFHEGAWYVGVPTGVIKLQDTDGDGVADSRATLIDNYPTFGHNTRTVLFLPDGRMVVSIGSSCNVCIEDDGRRGGIVAYDGPEATGEKIFATGLRNAVGLSLHPETGELWASNNGRDLMGDDTPPETVYLVKEGADYGWPRCHAGDIVDPEFGFEGACNGVGRPVIEMQAHSAPLGLAFYTGTTFPLEYHGDLFVAFHGSWNRSQPTGYKVVRVPMEGSAPSGLVEDFAWGWIDEGNDDVSGRPVGLAVGPDGALYVSDDKGGFIYRISYSGG